MLSRGEYQSRDATALADLVRTKAITPSELLDTAIAAIEAANPALNAVVACEFDLAREAALGPVDAEAVFAGVPFLAKDINVDIKGFRTTHACRFFADAPRAKADSLLVRRWRAAGLVIAGRSNTPEFATDFGCEPELFGPTSNPWDLTLTPGGSSGGAAAAVASGMVPMAHGSDSGGSIRAPAACCGLFGFKPSGGVVATGSPLGPLVAGLNCDHVISWSVRDSANMLLATAGPEIGAHTAYAGPQADLAKTLDTPPARLRIGVVINEPAGQVPGVEIASRLGDTISLLEELGHEVREWSWPADVDPFDSAVTCWTSELATLIDQHAQAIGRPPRKDELGPVVRWATARARQQSALDMVRARQHIRGLQQRMAQGAAGIDVILSPVLTGPPLPTGELTNLANTDVDAWAARAFGWAPFLEIFNVTGQPAMSVPLWQGADGMPIGMQLAAKVGQDAALLRLARQLEQARPWQGRRPPTQ